MARKLEMTTLPKRGNRKYPWEEWFDGSVWELRAGEDFTARPATFRTLAKQQAARRNIKVDMQVYESESPVRVLLHANAV
jgi:hypothetical protein